MSIQKVISDIEMLLGVYDDDARDLFEGHRSHLRATLGERRFRDMERRVYANARRKSNNFTNPVMRSAAMEIKTKVARNAIGINANNGIVQEYVNRARAKARDLITKVGDAQSELFQESERLAEIAKQRGDKNDFANIAIKHRAVDSLLNSIIAQLARLGG